MSDQPTPLADAFRAALGGRRAGFDSPEVADVEGAVVSTIMGFDPATQARVLEAWEDDWRLVIAVHDRHPDLATIHAWVHTLPDDEVVLLLASPGGPPPPAVVLLEAPTTDTCGECEEGIHWDRALGAWQHDELVACQDPTPSIKKGPRP